MTNEKFIEQAKELVARYATEHCDKTDTIPPFDDGNILFRCIRYALHKTP